MEKLIAGTKKLGLLLNSAQLEQFHIYYQELISWNRRMNLTTITRYKDVQIKHFLDALTVTLAYQPFIINAGFRIVDVGTGAGIPGIPINIVFPNLKLVLLESTVKKTAFLYYLKTKLGLDNIEIVAGRAEEIAHMSQYREKFDLVLSRGVASLPTLVELTLPFCAIGGSFIAQKKGSIQLEVSRAMRSINLMGGTLWEVKRVNLTEFDDERYLIIINKESSTPKLYPRRSGIPSKRPLLDKQAKP
ncbi:16S rRNA (guanine(527)-N(7))-methyltransferase RsmG [Chloroflexota bacterium]